MIFLVIHRDAPATDVVLGLHLNRYDFIPPLKDKLYLGLIARCPVTGYKAIHHGHKRLQHSILSQCTFKLSIVGYRVQNSVR